MSTLTLIGAPFPDLEAQLHAAAQRDLTEALAQTAPRGCSSRLIVPRDVTPPQFVSARAAVEAIPLNAAMLPFFWRSGTTARPLDGEFIHANTPLAPLRARAEDDGSQSSVLVPHVLAWDAPELLGPTGARSYRAFVRRAVKYADVLLAPTHTVAARLAEIYDIDVRVLPLAAPSELCNGDAAAARRAALSLPDRYVVTTAFPDEYGRLEWLFEAMAASTELPDLVVLNFAPQPLPPVPPALEGRVRVLQTVPQTPSEKQGETASQSAAGTAQATPATSEAEIPAASTEAVPHELADLGAALTGAQLLVLPQQFIGTGFEVLGALTASIPVLHAGSATVAELALDAAVAAETQEAFTASLTRLTSEAGAAELARLRIFAEDRNRAFLWRSTAWQLWDLHANI